MGNSSAVPAAEAPNVPHLRSGELNRHSLHCRVCDQRYNLVDRRPLVLPCNHVICQMCIRRNFTTEQSNCPSCAGPFNASLSVLRLDPHIVRMIEFLNNHRINICDQHDHQLLNFFCKTCFRPVCPDCAILNHRDSEGHVVVSIDMAIEENFTLFDDIENTNTEALRNFQDTLLRYDGLLQMVENNEPNIEIRIRNKFDELRTLLAQREARLLLELGTMRGEKNASLRTERTRVGADISELSERLRDFRTARQEGNVRNVFRVFQELQGQAINDRHRDLESQLATHSRDANFKPKNEDKLVEAIDEFGEIDLACVIS
ncbi:unnamed protein product [Lymnaea stagnalis]|uniref:RING-type domain-containing protein n=1 Tax=Lymnaea stagnalis TaxID=6523 RepID=A0AAV2ID75_LYMST